MRARRDAASPSALAGPYATTASPAPSSASGSTPPPTAGKVVVLDPGHNGGNARHPQAGNRLMPAGRGQTKPWGRRTCHDMRDAGEAALMSTSDGQRRYADAIADGVLAYLSRT